uniref:Tropomodulin 4 n=1 Tax=Cyanoderma ruficeps TaxID=181631 RepID=A0A8C3QXG8_9PASS
LALSPRELEKYRDIDEDKILRELSPEELAQLDAELAEMDPEVGTATPARGQDTRRGGDTGAFVPRTCCCRRGCDSGTRPRRAPRDPWTARRCCSTWRGRPWRPRSARTSCPSPARKKVWGQPGDSGDSVGTAGTPDRYRPVPDEPPNPTDVAETLQRLQDNDPALQDVNLNNIKDIPVPTLEAICRAIQTNTHVRSLSLVATRSNDLVANAVAEMLEQNRSLQSLNLESNFITSAGMMRLLGAVGQCPSLSELRVDNQCQRLGDSVEMAMAATLERCPSLLRLGYTFTLQGPRARAAAALTRNNELRECPRGHRGSPRVPEGHLGAT